MPCTRDLKPKRSRQFGKFSTKAELTLWNRLRSRALDNLKFIRQHPIGPFIVDFACREQRLVIELDGGRSPSERDQARGQWLAARGYRVLRFRNDEILGNIENVLEAIRFALAETVPHRARFALQPFPARGER